MRIIPRKFDPYFTLCGGHVSPDIPDDLLEELVCADIGDRRDGDGPLCDFSNVHDRYIPIRDRYIAGNNLNKTKLGHTD
jgi:hypothetical protein